MRVLIIENEIYLAQSIANKLSELGYACEIASSAEQLKANTHYDVLLLSTNVSGFDKFITHHRQSVIILLVSYISVDSVVEPLGAGASDYIQKPFMVEELVRKIKHHQHYKELETMNNAYLNFIAMRLASVQLPQLDYKKIRLPVFLQAHRFANADAFLFHYAKAHKMSFFCVQASPNDNAESILKLTNKADLLFVSHFHFLQETEQNKLLQELDKKPLIIHSSEKLANPPCAVFDLNDNEKDLSGDEILTIDEYVRYIILKHQATYPDTDLSKKLGISRKSLWEKRKKYGLAKKK